MNAANRAVSLDPADEWPHRLASNALLHLDNYPEARAGGHGGPAAGPGTLAGPYLRGAGGAGSPAAGLGHRCGPAGPSLAPNEPDVHFLSGKVSLAAGDLESPGCTRSARSRWTPRTAGP